MLGVLIQIDGWDPVAAAAVTLRLASHDDPALCMLNAQTWWPVLATLPVMRYDYFDGAFAGQIEAPSSSFSCSTAPWANFGRYALADARVRVWTGDVGAAWGAFTLRFDGRATAQPQISGGIAQVEFAVDDRWLDDPLLPTYAGTGGAEGPAALKGVAKPLALGAPRYVPGVLIDAVENIWQVSGAGVIESVEFALDRLVRLPAPAANAASYAALVSLTVANGQVATALSAGLVKHGAPAAGKTSYLVKGDKAGPDGWARTPGKVIRRLALLSGGSGKIADASLNALDTARPYNLSLYLGEQTTARGEIQALAAGVNAVAGVSWLGQLWAASIGFGTPVLTLAADGTALPPVASVRQIGQAAPFWRMTLGAERTWSVHGDGDYTAIDIWPAGAFTLVNVANCEITTPNGVTKISGGYAWNGKAYIREPMTSGCRLTCVVGGVDVMIGITTDPVVDADYASIDYTVQSHPDGHYYRWRNGTPSAAGPAWTAGDVLAFENRDGTISYFLNGAEITAFAHAANAANETLYAVFAIANPAAVISDITWSSIGAAGADGAPGIAAFLTNEAHTLPADASGNVSSYSGATGDFKIFSGTADVSANFTLSTQSNPQALTVGYTGRTYTITAGLDAGEDLALLTIRAAGSGAFAGVTIDRVFSLAKSKAGAAGATGAVGAAGANAKTLTVLSDRQTIAYDSAGAASPSTQTTTFSTNKQNTTGTVTWSITDAAGTPRTPVTSFLSAATGDSVTMTEAQFASARNGTSGVIVTGSITDGTTFADKISVVRVQAGAPGTNGVSPVNVTISPSTATVQLKADGTAEGLPINFLVKAQQGGSAISVTSVTITAETGADFSVSGATVTLDTWNGGSTDAQATLTVVAGGQTFTGVILPVASAKAGGGAGAATLAVGPTLTQANASSYGQVGVNLAINASSTGKLKLNLTGYVRPDIEDYRFDWKIEYSTNGGSSWTAVAGMPITSGFTVANLSGNIVGGATLTTGPYTVTGLGADTPCLVRALLQKHAGDPSAVSPIKTNLTLSAEQVA